jgi:polar amino acid transport system substrate-binding protein
MFSKKSVPLSVVEEFNEAIKSYVGSSEYNTVITEYLAPVMFLKTIDSPWFRIVEIIGTIAFALSGVMIAFQQRSTLLAAFLFSFLPSFGGGIARDVLFGIAPVYILRAPIYFIIVAGIVVFSYLVSHFAGNRISQFFDSLIPQKLKQRKDNFYLVLTDSLGLAAFTVSGVFVTLVAKVEPFWLWAPFFALLTSVAGGIVRDVVAKREKIVAFSGTPYGEWAIIWGFAFSLYLYFNAINISQEIVTQGIIVTILGVFFSRVTVYLLNVPNFKFKDTHKER